MKDSSCTELRGCYPGLRPGLLVVLVLVLATLVLQPTDSWAFDRPAFDRQAIHAQRLDSLELAYRGTGGSEAARQPRSAVQTTDIPAFRVSKSASPARFDQGSAEVVRLADGGWLAVWDDNRLGSRKIFWRRFDSSMAPVGGNTMVAGSSAGADYVDPHVAVDTLNRVYLFYRDRTNGLVFGSRYTGALGSDLSAFLVNDTSFNSFAGPFDLGVFPDGRLVVVWENYSTLGSTIEMRIYNASGVSSLGPATVNSESGSAQHWVPSVAVAPGSGFLVAWEDYRNGRADIYCRQFTGAGTAVGADLSLVPPPHNEADQYAPDIAYSVDDRYVVGWVDTRQGQEIYLQRYSQITGLVGSNTLVSPGDTMVVNWDISLTTESTGRTLATWADFAAASELKGLRLDSGLTAVGSPAVLNDNGLGRRWNPFARYADDGTYVLCWTEYVDENADIHVMRFDSFSAPMLASEVVVNDDALGAPSESPVYLASSPTRHVVVWVEQNRDAGDIYARTVNVMGAPWSSETRLNQDAGYSLQSEPAAAASDSRILAVWIDSRSVSGQTGQRIYGRYLALNGLVDGSEFLISDSTAAAVKASPQVAMAPDGSTLVAWVDQRDGAPQVWGRWLTAAGEADGAEFLVSDGATAAASDLHAGVDTTGRFGLCWFDAAQTPAAIQTAWYNADQSAAEAFDWTSDTAGVAITESAAAFGADGSLLIFWVGESQDGRGGYLAQLAFDGSVAQSSMTITADTLAAVSDPAVAVGEDGDVSLTWLDRRGGSAQVYYQILTGGLATVGDNEPVAAITPEYMQEPCTDVSRGRAWFAWADPRSEGPNIYAAGLTFNATDVDEQADLLPTGYELAQNYPNPFNPSTVISFTLPRVAEVRLSVFNVLGQEVVRLLDGQLPAGEHYVVWDGRDSEGNRAASGVYLYRLSTEESTQARKMMLLK